MNSTSCDYMAGDGALETELPRARSMLEEAIAAELAAALPSRLRDVGGGPCA